MQLYIIPFVPNNNHIVNVAALNFLCSWSCPEYIQWRSSAKTETEESLRAEMRASESGSKTLHKQR